MLPSIFFCQNVAARCFRQIAIHALKCRLHGRKSHVGDILFGYSRRGIILYSNNIDTNMRHLLIGCTLLCSLAVCACSKIDGFAEEDVGSYVLDEALWLGESEAGAFVDLDGDGKSSNRIDLELQRYNAVAGLMKYPLAGAVEAPDRNGSGRIWLRLPLQDLQKDGDSCIVRGAIAPSVGFVYAVASSGEVTISHEVDYSDIHNLSLGHYIDVNSAKILKVTGGEIEMTALIEYYDFNVRRILTAPVRFFYHRQ